MKETNPSHIFLWIFATMMIFSRVLVRLNSNGLSMLDNSITDLLGAVILYSGMLITIQLNGHTKKLNRNIAMTKDKRYQMSAFYELAKTCISTRQDFAALRYYKKAFDIAEEISDYVSKYNFYCLLDKTAKEMIGWKTGQNLLLCNNAFEERYKGPAYTKEYLEEIKNRRFPVSLNISPHDNFHCLHREDDVLQEDLLLMINVFKAIDQPNNVVRCGKKYIYCYLNEVRNIKSKMRVCLDIAEGLYQLREYEDVEQYCKKCIYFRSICGHKNDLCLTQERARMIRKMALGWRSLYDSERDTAFYHTSEAVKIAEKTKSRKLMIESYLKQAEFFTIVNEHKLAVDVLKTCALSRAEKLKEKNAILSIHLALTVCYMSLSKKQEASISLKDFFSALDQAGSVGCSLFESVALNVLFQNHENGYVEKRSDSSSTKRSQIQGNAAKSIQTIVGFQSQNYIPYLREILSKNVFIVQKLITRICVHLKDIDIVESRKNSKILKDLLDFLKTACQSTFYSEDNKALELSLFGAIEYASNQNANALKTLKQSVQLLDESINCINADGYQIALADRYIDSWKLVFKLLIEENRRKDALIISEQCRAKALKFQLLSKHLAQNYKDNQKEGTEYAEIESFIRDQKCTILYFVWCFDDLYCFLLKSTVSENGEHFVQLKMYFDRNCRQSLELDFKKLFGEMNGFLNQDSIKKVRRNKILGTSSENEECTCNTGNHFNCEQSFTSSIQRLSEMLFESVIDDINDTDKIVIIPEGLLYLIPFAALINPTTKRHLSQDKQLLFSPSIDSLLIHQTLPDDYYARSGSLIIGNPLVDQIEGLESLAGSQKEAETIARIINGVMPLIGPRATKSAVLERLFEVCIAHFACHIKLDPSAIVLSPEGSPQHVDDESYLLKPEDIMEKDIHARLVVLSGCNSGLGKICAEGVVGIARAFLAAGASAVLVSRWSVGDYSTCEFMTIFYTYLLDWDVRRSASESLHLTINDMRAKYPHEPMKWSGFYLMGDDVTIDRESLSVLRTKREPPASPRREPSENDE